MSNRRINVPKHPGIRKDVVTGMYQAAKKIKGRQFAETFENLRDAIHWKNTFNGDRSKKEEVKTTSTLGHGLEPHEDPALPFARTQYPKDLGAAMGTSSRPGRVPHGGDLFDRHQSLD